MFEISIQDCMQSCTALLANFLMHLCMGLKEYQNKVPLQPVDDQKRHCGSVCKHQQSCNLLLPDVAMSMSSLSICRAPEALVEWGTLRQLHTTLTRCIGPHIVQFDVIMRKMLEVVRALPFTADDVHNTRNAHGSFADTLRELADKRQAAKLKTEKVTHSSLSFCTAWF